MKCLLKYPWVKLPREILPQGKSIMSAWAKLASRVAFRSGKASYCGHVNEVDAGSWAGGVVGIKSILGVRSRQHALDTVDTLSRLGFIEYHLDAATKKLTYRILDWVVEGSGKPCPDGVIYATEGYGFICAPRSLTQRLIDQGYYFDDSDAWLDLWCHTVYQDPRNAFSYIAPTVQYGRYGTVCTLETLGQRWGWEKTEVWRFLQKHRDAFTLRRLPGSFGCLIYNALYPTGAASVIPTQEETIRTLNAIRNWGCNTHWACCDNARINRMVAWYSKAVVETMAPAISKPDAKSRVAVLPPIRAYLSPCRNYRNITDCWKEYRPTELQAVGQNEPRGPCRVS